MAHARPGLRRVRRGVPAGDRGLRRLRRAAGGSARATGIARSSRRRSRPRARPRAGRGIHRDGHATAEGGDRPHGGGRPPGRGRHRGPCTSSARSGATACWSPPPTSSARWPPSACSRTQAARRGETRPILPGLRGRGPTGGRRMPGVRPGPGRRPRDRPAPFLLLTHGLSPGTPPAALRRPNSMKLRTFVFPLGDAHRARRRTRRPRRHHDLRPTPARRSAGTSPTRARPTAGRSRSWATAPSASRSRGRTPRTSSATKTTSCGSNNVTTLMGNILLGTPLRASAGASSPAWAAGCSSRAPRTSTSSSTWTATTSA